MSNYEVRYKAGDHVEAVVVSGSDESDAGRKFRSSYPNVSADDILTVRDQAAKSNGRQYGGTRVVGQVIALIGLFALLAGIAVLVIAINELGRSSMAQVYGAVALATAFFGLLLLGAGLLIDVTAANASTSKEILTLMKSRWSL